MRRRTFNARVSSGGTEPSAWADTLSGSPTVSREFDGIVPFQLRHWRSIDPAIDQWPLDRHYVSVHLGGRKRLTRNGEGATRVEEAACGAFSIVSAGAAYRWMTEGPVDFAHVYVDADDLGKVVEEAFGRDPRRIELHDAMGRYDPLVHQLGQALVEEMANEHVNRAYVDDLIHLLALRLLRVSSDVGTYGDLLPGRMAPVYVRRATDFLEHHLERPIGVADMAAAAGISVFHFSRGFKSATGLAPYAYLTERRIRRACAMLGDVGTPMSTIAAACGFASSDHLAKTFRKIMGVSPTAYRRSL